MAKKKEPLPLASRQILVADDEKDICDLFRRIVSGGLANCRIDMAVNGTEAVHAFYEGRYSVIVMDIHMPVMDGFTAFKKIQQLCKTENWAMPAVIFYTGFRAPKELEAIVAKEPRHCILYKPVNIETLIDAIKSRIEP